MKRTRIKICGLSSAEHVAAAVDAGADAIGLVFYPKSPRYIAPAEAGKIISGIAPYVSVVGLFVNASIDEVRQVLEAAPISLLQFHGDESVEDCVRIAEAVNRPFVRAVRVAADMTGTDLLQCEQDYRAASTLFNGLLLDAHVDGYGGGGKVFDWSLIPKELAPRAVLSGGLSAQNAIEAIARVRPYAVDVSSGVEVAKGIKDIARIRAFIDAVGKADAAIG
ncbi:MAG TPA: phosphoribosylanthranilate isomerase [Noviherbaspirillum sp.]|jgi:phosphoribosylanthranilate isomerase|uniref:phosphoribosylanthranilate isomerase n=1 Tax=Noviherbaspirillum sp. TaxID=1926288 RepID=UPI002DDDBA11|nr:phosphoribosylanthranilate isomerase [Noviherbaspirillum sp.]HEV2609592.1 phosphoribosylanthranilate isomerase [Noviherbaspirillum sp.]